MNTDEPVQRRFDGLNVDQPAQDSDMTIASSSKSTLFKGRKKGEILTSSILIAIECNAFQTERVKANRVSLSPLMSYKILF